MLSQIDTKLKAIIKTARKSKECHLKKNIFDHFNIFFYEK